MGLDSKPRKLSKSMSSGKKSQRRKRSAEKEFRIPDSDLAPPVRLVDPMKLYGMPWAVKNGFAHFRRCSRKDARIIVQTLGISPSEEPEEHNTAFGELVVLEFPWRWLEKFDKAGGDFAQLSIRPKFPSSYI